MFKQIRYYILFLAGFCMTSIYSQEATVTAGGDISGSNGSASYSVGSVVYYHYEGSNGSVLPGVMQPYEISEVTSSEVSKDLESVVLVYPNPVVDNLNLMVEIPDTSGMHYELYDMNGRLLENRKLEGVNTIINMSNQASEIYFIKVIQENVIIKIFKVIKH